MLSAVIYIVHLLSMFCLYSEFPLSNLNSATCYMYCFLAHVLVVFFMYSFTWEVNLVRWRFKFSIPVGQRCHEVKYQQGSRKRRQIGGPWRKSRCFAMPLLKVAITWHFYHLPTIEYLNQNAAVFERTATRLKRKLWWQNVKVRELMVVLYVNWINCYNASLKVNEEDRVPCVIQYTCVLVHSLLNLSCLRYQNMSTWFSFLIPYVHVYIFHWPCVLSL